MQQTGLFPQFVVYLANLEAVARYDVLGGMLAVFDETGQALLLYGAQ